MNEFEKDSYDLFGRLIEKSKFLCNRIDFFERKTEEDHAYYGYVKNFLVTDGILCDEIMAAIHNDKVLIALVAARNLLEELINIEYLLSKTSRLERNRIAMDWIDRSNNPESHKNMLDNISVLQRARAAGPNIEQIYENEYGMMCDYVHGSAQRGIINALDSHRNLAAKKAIYMSLLAYSNIIFAASTLAELPTAHNTEIESSVRTYLNRYKEQVAEAQI